MLGHTIRGMDPAEFRRTNRTEGKLPAHKDVVRTMQRVGMTHSEETAVESDTCLVDDFARPDLAEVLRGATTVASRANCLESLIGTAPAGPARDGLTVTFDRVETCPLSEFYELVSCGDIDPNEEVSLEAAALLAVFEPVDATIEISESDDPQVLSQADIDALFGKETPPPAPAPIVSDSEGIGQNELDKLFGLTPTPPSDPAPSDSAEIDQSELDNLFALLQ